MSENNNPTSNQYISERNRHCATLREVARDGTVEIGAFKAALNWAVNNLEGLPEDWVIAEDYEAAIEAGAEEIAESQRLRAALGRIEAIEHTPLSNYKKSLQAWAIAKDALSGQPQPVETSEPPAVSVEGDMLPTTLAQFVLRAQRLLADEQRKPNPDNALIGFMCDAVRLARENAKLATSPLNGNG